MAVTTAKLDTLTELTAPLVTDLVYMEADPATNKYDRKVQFGTIRQDFNVKDYGAAGDGVADDTAAIRATIAAALAATVTKSDGLPTGFSHSSGSGPVVFFPAGKYVVNDYLTEDVNMSLNYISIVGANAIILPSADTITVFGGVGFMVRFRGITVRAGDVAINIKTNNTNGAKIDIVDCEFLGQKTASIATDATSNSTILNIGHCKFYQRGGSPGYIGYFLSGDYIYISHCWLQCHSATAFYTDEASLYVSQCVGVPGGDMVAAGGCWFDQQKRVLDIERFRMGGESSGADTLVKCYAGASATAPTRLSIRDCPAYAGTYAVKLYALPNVIEIKGITGMTSAELKQGLYIDAGITQAERQTWQLHGRIHCDQNWTRRLRFVHDAADASQAVTARVLLAGLAREGLYDSGQRDRIPESDVVGSGEVITGWSQATLTGYTGLVSSNVDNAWGVTERVYTASADLSARACYNLSYVAAAAADANEVYTFVLQVEASNDDPALVSVQVGGAMALTFEIHGKRTLCVPFVWLNDTGLADDGDLCYITAYAARNGDVVKLGRQMLLKGIHRFELETLRLRSAAAPTGYTPVIATDIGYSRGDTCENTAVAPGSPWSWVCTAEGNPGTWVPVCPTQSANAYATSNVSTTRTLDANGGDIAAVSDVLCTLIEDLKTCGLLKSP